MLAVNHLQKLLLRVIAYILVLAASVEHSLLQLSIMKAGEQVFVKVGERISENKFRVVTIDNTISGVLNVKGRLKVDKDGTTKAWVIDFDKKSKRLLCGNSYFGKYSISDGISNRYKSIISSLFDKPHTLTDNDISILKGMANRCLKFDQWDWLTTYKYLGFPAKPLLKSFIDDCLQVRDNIRTGDMSTLENFSQKYSFMLNSILFHLNLDRDEGIDDASDTTIQELQEEDWNKLSSESKNNIRMIKKYFHLNSAYFLMYFFVTLEQEFINNYIMPFIEANKNKTFHRPCSNSKYLKTHNILIGKENFSLGAIYFLGMSVSDSEALKHSSAIYEFNLWLNRKKEEFKSLCFEISNCRVGKFYLTKMRNGIAHGEPETIAKIPSTANTDLYNYLFRKPHELIIKILRNSLKYNASR